MGAVTPHPTLRVLIVDDDPLVRAGLRLILGADQQISIVGEAGDGEAVEAAVRASAPTVVLMDIRMPTLDGVAATERLLAGTDPPRVLLLTTVAADDMVVRGLSAGASGYLLKDTAPAAIIAAVHAVARGTTALSPAVADGLVRRRSAPGSAGAAGPTGRAVAPAPGPLDSLTGREREVATAVAQGMSNAEIAAALFMSVATVKAHVGHIMTKLDIDNRVQLALMVHDAG